MQASDAKVLWVNLCKDAENVLDCVAMQKRMGNLVLRRIEQGLITSAVQRERPDIICLDYDFPDRQGLWLLRHLRVTLPAIPVIMITLQHCESLAVWAFRTGVRDFLVKPQPLDTVVELLSNLITLKVPRTAERRAPRQNVLPPPLLPNEYRHDSATRSADCTILAICYVETHFYEKIPEKDVAELCGMSVFAFSKLFRQEHGMTFREFLIRHRIERAKDLLRNPATSATDVAGLVGFSDASSFSRLFRRYVGQTPSVFRQGQATGSSLTTKHAKMAGQATGLVE